MASGRPLVELCPPKLTKGGGGGARRCSGGRRGRPLSGLPAPPPAFVTYRRPSPLCKRASSEAGNPSPGGPPSASPPSSQGSHPGPRPIPSPPHRVRIALPPSNTHFFSRRTGKTCLRWQAPRSLPRSLPRCAVGEGCALSLGLPNGLARQLPEPTTGTKQGRYRWHPDPGD